MYYKEKYIYIVLNKCSYLAFLSSTAVNYKYFSKLPKPAWRWSQHHFPIGWLTDCLKTIHCTNIKKANRNSLPLFNFSRSQDVSEPGFRCPVLALARCCGLDFPTSVSSFRARCLTISLSCPHLCPLGLPGLLPFCALLPLPPITLEPVVLHSPNQPLTSASFTSYLTQDPQLLAKIPWFPGDLLASSRDTKCVRSPQQVLET